MVLNLSHLERKTKASDTIPREVNTLEKFQDKCARRHVQKRSLPHCNIKKKQKTPRKNLKQSLTGNGLNQNVSLQGNTIQYQCELIRAEKYYHGQISKTYAALKKLLNNKCGTSHIKFKNK